MKVMLGIPSYSWGVKMGTLRSLLADTVQLVGRGDSFTLYDEAGNTEISLAREHIAEHFLSSGYDSLVFIDDDVSWQAGGLLKLLDYPVDVVGAAYPKRKDPLEWSVGWLPDRKELHAVNGLLEVASLATGFLKLSRKCLESMFKEYGSSMFDNIRDDHGRYSEDISFCARWRNIGGQVWLDPEIKMGHVGPKSFNGCMGDWLRARM